MALMFKSGIKTVYYVTAGPQKQEIINIKSHNPEKIHLYIP